MNYKELKGRLKGTENINLLGITNSWPPIVSGHGNFFSQILKDYKQKIVIAPHGAEPDSEVATILKFSTKAGGWLKLFSVLQHLEILLIPLYVVFSFKKKPKVVLASQVLFSGLSAYIIKLFYGIPYIVFAHGEEFSIFYYSNSKFKLRVSKLILKNAECIICNTSFTKGILYENYGIPDHKLEIIHPSVNVEEILKSKLTNSRYNYGSDRIILSVGRLWEERKGFDIAIKAMSKLITCYPNTKLVFIGPGRQDKLKKLARDLKIEDKVIFLGKVERNILLYHYSVSDIFLMPNRQLSNGDIEGFGIVFIEANLFKKPVIAGRSGGAVDAVEHMKSGLLVNGESVDEVLNAILTLFNNNELRLELGNGGYKRAIDNFNVETQKKLFSNLMEKYFN